MKLIYLLLFHYQFSFFLGSLDILVRSLRQAFDFCQVHLYKSGVLGFKILLQICADFVAEVSVYCPVTRDHRAHGFPKL